ncbi:hypothetical protein ACI68E_001210 [Malassezia pachydermatis]
MILSSRLATSPLSSQNNSMAGQSLPGIRNLLSYELNAGHQRSHYVHPSCSHNISTPGLHMPEVMSYNLHSPATARSHSRSRSHPYNSYHCPSYRKSSYDYGRSISPPYLSSSLPTKLQSMNMRDEHPTDHGMYQSGTVNVWHRSMAPQHNRRMGTWTGHSDASLHRTRVLETSPFNSISERPTMLSYDDYPHRDTPYRYASFSSSGSSDSDPATPSNELPGFFEDMGTASSAEHIKSLSGEENLKYTTNVSGDILKKSSPVMKNESNTISSTKTSPSAHYIKRNSGRQTSQGGKFECSYCKKRFSRPSSLRTHIHSHTGEKPFRCDVPGCGRCFSVNSNLRRHQKCHNIQSNDHSKATRT